MLLVVMMMVSMIMMMVMMPLLHICPSITQRLQQAAVQEATIRWSSRPTTRHQQNLYSSPGFRLKLASPSVDHSWLMGFA